MQGAWVWFPDGELRYPMCCTVWPKKNPNEPSIYWVSALHRTLKKLEKTNIFLVFRELSSLVGYVGHMQQQQDIWGFPGDPSDKEPTCQCRRFKKCGFSPWVGKIPWSRAWQPTPVFLPGESHGKSFHVSPLLSEENLKSNLEYKTFHHLDFA